jgi:DNA-binding beta-propeller fold protein YncE
MPVSVAQHQNRVYVLNQGGSGAVVVFNLDSTGHPSRIPNATALLSAKLVAGEDVSVSPDGQFVVVIEQLVDPASFTRRAITLTCLGFRPMELSD